MYKVFLIGVFLGFISWAILPGLSSNSAPWDSVYMFPVEQITISIVAFYIAFKHNIKNLLVFLLGYYLIHNICVLAGVSSDFPLMLLLVSMSNLTLIVYPSVAGILGVLRRVMNKHKSKNRPSNRL